MLKYLLIGSLIIASGVFIIWRPWKGFLDFLRLNESPAKNMGEGSKVLIKLLLIPVLMCSIIVSYIFFYIHHEHDACAETIIKEATCTEIGIIQCRCRYCDKEYQREIPLLEHQYEETGRTEPTCIEEGRVVATCKACGGTREEAIPSAAHQYEETGRTEPTCIEEGRVVTTCKVCGDTREEAIPFAAHQYEETDRTEPTCIEEGRAVTTCKVCGDTREEAIPFAAHQYEETDRTEPSCMEEGRVVTTCKVCGDTQTQTIPIVGHQYGETGRTDPTCTEEGTIVYTCEMCKDVKTEVLPMVEHTYLEAERAAQTCLEPGWVIFRCQYCGLEKTEALPADGEHQYTVTSFQAEEQTATYVCGRCGTVHKESLSPEEMKLLWTKLEIYHARKDTEITEIKEAEPNRKTSIATPVENFQRVTANLANMEDVDCFSFTVSRRSDMEFDFSHDDGGGAGYHWYATVYDTDGVSVIKEGSISHGSQGEVTTFRVDGLEPGTYYLKISDVDTGNPLLNYYTDAFYHITFRPKCTSHDVTRYLLKAPGCLQDGEYIEVCSECDEQISTGVIQAFGHEWSEWHTLKEAGLLSRGEQKRTCSICMATERKGFLHIGSVIMMIVIAVIMIGIIIALAVNGNRGGMAAAIIITVVLLIVFYAKFFAGSRAKVSLAEVKTVSIVRVEVASGLPVKNAANPITNSIDGDLMTCWQDGTDGDGKGTVLIYYFEHPCYAVGMDIINGRVAVSEENYYQNNRIRSMTLYYFRDGAVTGSVELNDMEDVYSREYCHYTLAPDIKDEAYYCDGIQIVIDSVYEGSAYDDLCLTEIQFYERVYE